MILNSILFECEEKWSTSRITNTLIMNRKSKFWDLKLWFFYKRACSWYVKYVELEFIFDQFELEFEPECDFEFAFEFEFEFGFEFEFRIMEAAVSDWIQFRTCFKVSLSVFQFYSSLSLQSFLLPK